MARLIGDAGSFAVSMGHPAVGSEHLLMALASSGPASSPLQHAGLTAARIQGAVEDLCDGDVLDRLDGRALTALDVEVESVRAALQRSFGTDALRPAPTDRRWVRLLRRRGRREHPGLTRRAAESLAAAAATSADRAPDATDVAIAVLDQRGGLVPRVLDRLEVDAQALRAHLAQRRAAERSPVRPVGRRVAFIWIGGFGALLGGVLTAASSLTHFHGATRPLVPVGVACLAAGVAGLHAAMWGREAALRRWGSGLAATGIGLGVIGMAGSALGVVGHRLLARIINTGEHAGLVFIGAGMLAWGIASVRARALGRWSAAPLGIALLALVGLVSFSPTLFAAVESSPLPALFGLSWTLLGFGLLALNRRPGGFGTAAR